MSNNSLSHRDSKIIWHPYTPLLREAPVAIARAEREYLHTTDGKKLIDLISSWWVNLHGHNHPHIRERLCRQLEALDHVIFAGFTHEPAVELAERLLPKLPGEQRRIFYSDNGSTAVEVAIKMAVQYWANRGEKREKIAILSGGYHGDTVGSMSVSDRGVFTRAFKNLLFDVTTLPRPSGDGDQFIEAVQAAALDGTIAAFIYEPLVQGAGGMHMYDAHILDRALEIFQKSGILCIADEVMTGFGRTGRWFASDYLSHTPDLICLSKGITGGTMPLGVTTCGRRIEEAFLNNDLERTFFHGHSYTANPLACAAACASLDLMERPETWQGIARIENLHTSAISHLAHIPTSAHVRVRGTILALDVVAKGSGYLSPIGLTLYRFFQERGFLIRPLGNVIYLMPPYCMSTVNLEAAYDVIASALEASC